MTSVYYNENDKRAASWLGALQTRNLLPLGRIDQRSIEEINADDPQATSHFFAGIGGWPYALQLMDWPDGRDVWTGSCPCQPFSVAGKQLGSADRRHLWPAWLRILTKRRPATVFGEQVASPAGRRWLNDIRIDLEALGYAFGAADLCAAGLGAPHIRQRLYWGANTDRRRLQGSRPATPWKDAVEQFKRLVQSESRMAISAGKDRLLADGLPNRMGRLRGYGNAIVPQVGALFMTAFMDVV